MRCQITDTIETYARKPVRIWTVPIGDCVAFPTPNFHQDRMVVFSNEGSALYPKWVCLDRYNDDDWHENRYEHSDLTGLYDLVISSAEGADLQYPPEIFLAPPPLGATWLTRLTYRLSHLV